MYTFMTLSSVKEFAKANKVTVNELYAENSWIKAENRLHDDFLVIKSDERLKVPTKTAEKTTFLETEAPQSIQDILDLRNGNDTIHQKITARLKIPDYNPIASFIPGKESFSVYTLRGESKILDGYEYILDFVSDESIEVEDITDLNAEVYLRDEHNPLKSKKIYGKILEAKEMGSVARKKLYQVKIVSPLQYLSLNQRYEVYQEKSVPEIISSVVLRYSELLDLTLKVKVDLQSVPKRHTCTQYKQSDLDFIKMLCKEEGYVLLFDTHSNDPYTITLCELNEHAPFLHDVVECDINYSKKFSTSAQVQDYFENRKPSLDFSIQTGQIANNVTMSDNESTSQLRTDIKNNQQRDRLDKLDESLAKDLLRYAKIDAERGVSQGIRIEGKSEDISLGDGLNVRLKDLKGHKTAQVIILSTRTQATFPNALDEYTQVTGDDQPAQFSVEYEAIASDVVYKPQSPNNKVRIEGMTTAIVSNGSKDSATYANEIDVNEFGEIRVLFHFDENRPTSCYVPLSNAFSGDSYGSQFIPRVNSEVIVEFINGDIDRPVITGTLHNGENRHPYALPKEKTKSFIRTQTTPQYEDKEGYNELLFEDKQKEERLSLRAQRDYELHVLNDASTHVQNNAKRIIETDEELTVKNDFSTTIGKDSRVNIGLNNINVIEKEEITTVKEDSELNVLKDKITIVNENKMNVVQQDLIERIKGVATLYVEKDAKEKYLQNLFTQVGAQLGVDVTGAFELKAKSIKETAKTIDLDSADGVSLKVGGNVLTIDSSGIHFKTALYDANSGNGGVSSSAVNIVDLQKPLYEKLRVVGMTTAITKQDNINQELIYTAKVEKYNNGEWAETTDLEETQKLQLNWYFIKNNDDQDTEVLMDKLTEDDLEINGLTMKVTLEDDNKEQFAHAHCFVNSPEDETEGYGLSELKRQLDVQEVLGRNLLDVNATEANYRVQLNIDNPTPDEIKDLKVEIHEKDETGKVTVKEAKVEEELTVKYEMVVKEKDAPKVVELRAKVYPKGYPSNSAEGISYIRPLAEEDEMVNARGDDNSGEYIGVIKNDIYHIKAETSLDEGTEVVTVLHIKDKNGNIMKSVERETYVEDGAVNENFNIKEIIENDSLNKRDIGKIEGEIQWDK